MKNLFSWRLTPSESDFSKLWEKAVFVFDTNFLLDLYRVSRSTAENFLKILELVQDRIWLPYQVVDEFFKHREDIIEETAVSFEKALSVLEQWKTDQQKFSELRGKLDQSGRIVASEITFLYEAQSSYLDAINNVEKAFREKIEQSAETHASLSADEDNILEKLLLLFDLKVGKPFDEKNLQKLYKEGEDRYKQLKPPGFKDSKKEGNRKYGDYLIWREILDFAKKESRPIIFVTGDKKEDWWNKKGGKITYPHPDLRREFQEDVKQLFWMYQPARFLEMARDRFNIEIDLKSIEETDAISDDDLIDEQEREVIRQAFKQEPTSTLRGLEKLRTTVPGAIPFEKFSSGESLSASIEAARIRKDFDFPGFSIDQMIRYDSVLEDEIRRRGRQTDELIKKAMTQMRYDTVLKDEIERRRRQEESLEKVKRMIYKNPALPFERHDEDNSEK